MFVFKATVGLFNADVSFFPASNYMVSINENESFVNSEEIKVTNLHTNSLYSFKYSYLYW